MKLEDIKQAREEAKRFVKFTDDLLKALDGKDFYYWDHPAETGIVKAQSIILSRALSAMRNPWTCRRSKGK